jgi:hypothetical protein
LIHNKWWKIEQNEAECVLHNEKPSNSLDLSKLGGAYLIVAFVLFMSLVVFSIELILKAKQ